MTRNRNSTRYYSSRQEKDVAKSLGGRCVANSGAVKFGCGDVVTRDWLIECKTATKAKAQFTIQREWLKKNREEAFAMRKPHNALCFDFGNGSDRYYVISEKDFQALMQYYKELGGA